MNNIYKQFNWRNHYRRYQSKMLRHQLDALDYMTENNIATICMPTGTGKSRIIYGDMMGCIQEEYNNIFVVVTHRLLLNAQHITELFNTFKPALSNIGFIFIGSSQVDLDDFAEIECNIKLAEYELSYKDLISSTINAQELHEIIKTHKKNNRDIIIISTYNSLGLLKNVDNIHTIYFDEAQYLASPQNTQFRTNFNSLKLNRRFFFTATPKDSIENIDNKDDTFLMNNKKIFGERIGLTFKDAVGSGYIVNPYLHIVYPENYKSTKKYLSPENYTKVIIDSFKRHSEQIKNTSCDSTKLAPKILIKCSSVNDMWNINEVLINNEYVKENNIHIFAGASRSDNNHNCSYLYNTKEIKSKTTFLKHLKELNDIDQAIILHYDILSEGIDVSGITGVMFLSKTLPTKSKIIQTVGRATRLHTLDRSNIENKLLAITDKHKFIKPNCAVIIPILDEDMEDSANGITKLIKTMRDEYNFNPAEMIISGSDIATGKSKNELEHLNNIDTRRRVSRIDKIKHELEILDGIDNEMTINTIINELHDKKENNYNEWINNISKLLLNIED